jgi:hypothetical protein
MIWIILIIISLGFIVYAFVKLDDFALALGCGLFAITLYLAATINTEDEKTNNTYTIVAIAEDTNYLKTKDGNIWRVKEDLEVGKKYKVKFDSKGTDNVIDDEILEIN